MIAISWVASWLTMLRTLPGGLVARVATYLLALTIGLAFGNHWATERAVDRELKASDARATAALQDSADRQRQNHQELIVWYAGKMKELRLLREQQIVADNTAYALMEKTKADTARALKVARAQIAKLMEPKPNVALPSPDPGCVLTPGLRVTIDDAIASINNRPNAGPAQAPASGLASGPHPEHQPLTCRELVAGLVNTLDHDAMVTALALSWQAWASEALK